MHDGGGGGFGGHDGGFGGGHHGGIGGGGLGGIHHHHHSTNDGSGQIPQYGVAPIRRNGGPGGVRRASMTARYVWATVIIALLFVALGLLH